MHPRKNFYIFLFMLLQFVHCKKPYEPAVLKAANNYLVVDGFINTGAGTITTIYLSRTKNLTDTVVSIPESGASISIQNEGGVSYPLQETTPAGTYVSNALNLDNNGRYRLVITTSIQSQYQSELVSPVQTPPIDSVIWKQPNDLNIYVHTHDPSNATRFYRWEYIETYEHHSLYESTYGVSNGFIFNRDTSNFVHICWTSAHATDILLGTSAALSQDVISAAPLAVIPQNDPRLEYRYSILVKQYSLKPEAYYYWQIIQKSSQHLGTLFDLQPSQLVGNIHAFTHPGEPVVGFVSATTEQQKRIFIDHPDLFNWVVPAPQYFCQEMEIAKDPLNYLHMTTNDTTFVPWYFVTFGGLKIVKKECVDCTLKGGTNHRPSFWK